ncbi:MAG: SoxR reducing system RseC family protein [Candidatus Glassbacteria bacterium]|nr:SoxR reducing system RseC family protein [Candidatus Glassbacteria bacterium]
MKPTSTATICSRGKVIGSEGGMAQVEVSRSAMCDGCHQEGACHVTLLESGQNTIALVRNPLDAKPGDRVEIAVDEEVVIRGSVVLYILPLAFMLGAILLALGLKERLGLGLGDDTLALLSALGGLALSLPVIRLWSGRSKYLTANIPVITEILPDNE